MKFVNKEREAYFIILMIIIMKKEMRWLFMDGLGFHYFGKRSIRGTFEWVSWVN